MLSRLSGNKLTKNERLIYDILVLLEKAIGWSELILYRNDCFLIKNKEPTTASKKKSVNDDKKTCKQASQNKPPNKKEKVEENTSYEVSSSNNENHNDEEYTEELDESENTDELESSLSNESNTEDKKQKLTKSDAEDEKIPNPTLMMKRYCEKLDSALLCLCDDLTAYYYWESEENAEEHKDKSGMCSKLYYYSSKIWIYRGLLAERLQRTKMAELAYRRVILKGFSMLAWSRLLNLYTDANNIKASIACIAEVLDHFNEALGVKNYDEGIPEWLEESLFKLISYNGDKIVIKAIKEENCIEVDALLESIKKAKTRRVYNYLGEKLDK